VGFPEEKINVQKRWRGERRREGDEWGRKEEKGNGLSTFYMERTKLAPSTV
jgi:hypothetical protein